MTRFPVSVRPTFGSLLREQRAVQTAGLLTERTPRALWHAQHGRPRHVAAREPGEVVCLDTFYIGQLKGVSKVWHITACDAACSYGVAWLLPAHTAAAAAHFLRRVSLPVYRRAGWRLRRVLTGSGPEFTGAFDEVCRALDLRPTRTKSRHAWTNGFVERLQGSALCATPSAGANLARSPSNVVVQRRAERAARGPSPGTT